MKVPLLTEGGDIDMALINILVPAIIKTKNTYTTVLLYCMPNEGLSIVL